MGSKFYFVPGKMENKIIQEKQANHSLVVFFNASWFWLLLKKPKMEKPFSIPIWGFVSHQLKRYSIRQGLFSDLYLWQQWRRRHTEQTCGHCGGRRGWENQHGNTYITKCRMDGQCQFLHEARHPGPVLCDSLEGWLEREVLAVFRIRGQM